MSDAQGTFVAARRIVEFVDETVIRTKHGNEKYAPKVVAHVANLKCRSGLPLLRRSSRSVTSSPRFLAARDCGLDHPGSMSLALKTGAAVDAVRNLISDLAASAFLLALETHAMKTR
jgi:hypothetical protein